MVLEQGWKVGAKEAKEAKEQIQKRVITLRPKGILLDGQELSAMSRQEAGKLEFMLHGAMKRAEWESKGCSSVLDRHGICQMAGISLISNLLIVDMPGIIRSWLLVEYPNLPKHQQESAFQNAMGFRLDSKADHITASACRSIALIVGAAEAGSDFSRQFLLYLFKTYQKREYKALKKFRVLHASEIEAFTKDESVREEDPASYYFTKARIIYMAELMGIEIHEECLNDYFSLSAFVKKEESALLKEERESRVLSEKVTDEILSKAGDRIRALYAPGEKGGETYRSGQDFVNFCLRMDRKSNDLNIALRKLKKADSEEDIREAAARLLALNPEKELSSYSPGELELYGVILSLTDAISEEIDDVESWADRLVFEKGPFYEEAEIRSLFDEGEVRRILRKIRDLEDTGEKKTEKVQRKALTPTKRETAMKELREELQKEQEEIGSLRAQLRAVQEKAEGFHDLLKSREKENRSLQAQLRSLLEDKEELNALRDHVYKKSLEEEREAFQLPTERQEEISRMTVRLRQRKAAIVGGNPNWTKKLRLLLPDWLYISPEVTGSTRTSVLTGVERVFFFTEVLGHSTYFRFIRQVRESRIPFSYLSGVNIERNIVDLYQEMAG